MAGSSRDGHPERELVPDPGRWLSGTVELRRCERVQVRSSILGFFTPEDGETEVGGDPDDVEAGDSEEDGLLLTA